MASRGAELILVTSQEIDEFGESDNTAGPAARWTAC